MLVRILLAIGIATPASAQVAYQIPEPTDAALFVVAVVGLIVGRVIAARTPSRHRDDAADNDWDA